jgi:hypothetical protein
VRTAVSRLGQPERAFQGAVLELAMRLGWRTFHARKAQNARGDWRTPVAGHGAGFPDLVLVRGGRVLFVELKADRGRLSPAQASWGNALEMAAWEAPGVVRYFVWRPRDWPEIERELGARR